MPQRRFLVALPSSPLPRRRRCLRLANFPLLLFFRPTPNPLPSSSPTAKAHKPDLPAGNRWALGQSGPVQSVSHASKDERTASKQRKAGSREEKKAEKPTWKGQKKEVGPRPTKSQLASQPTGHGSSALWKFGCLGKHCPWTLAADGITPPSGLYSRVAGSRQIGRPNLWSKQENKRALRAAACTVPVYKICQIKPFEDGSRVVLDQW